jgi:4-hydroxybenzoate polyprenyltransferase
MKQLLLSPQEYRSFECNSTMFTEKPLSSKKEWIDAILHLRLHFSVLLLPVYLFGLSQTPHIDSTGAVFTFIVLHLLVYPASNVFNSFYDNDEGSIGGLKQPPPKNNKMLYLANGFDLAALAISWWVHPLLALLVLTYILASRAYSYKPVRLKKYPVTGFLVIFVFQGGFTYLISVTGSSDLMLTTTKEIFTWLTKESAYALLACSFQIGAVYPLTQVYQHQSDKADGVTTLSMKLGIRGTFIFSSLFFLVATFFYGLHFMSTELTLFYHLLLFQLPILVFFAYWAVSVWQNPQKANFKNTMRMNVIAASCLNLFFIYLLLL